MDKNLIDAFRDNVNEDYLVYLLYRDQNKKNRWNIICSAMDWISVSVDGICSCSLNLDNSNDASLKMINFIMYVDILWEAIQQLHRVIFNTKTIPFEGEKNIFKGNNLIDSDNNYFKTIRACFAAHPVNLNDYFTTSDEKEQRYAGWSGKVGGTGDFSVVLYSNVVGKDAVWFGIYIDELLEFAKRNYEYLIPLQRELNHQKTSYKNRYKATKIEQSDSIEKQIEILIDESYKRFDNDYCKYRLGELKMIFSTKIQNSNNRVLVDQYQSHLVGEVNLIFSTLQNMDLNILNEALDDDQHIPFSCHYPFSKLSDAVHGGCFPYLVDIEALKSHIGDIAQLDDISSLVELYVVVLAAFYVKSNT